MELFQSLFGTVTTRAQRIVNFEDFILSHVPYGQVDPSLNLQKGLVQFDGPFGNPGDVVRPPLQWHFGGIPYAISKAARLEYSYNYWDGSGVAIYASILMGFQEEFDQLTFSQSPRIEIPNDGALEKAIRYLSHEQLPAELRGAAVSQATSVITGSSQGFVDLDSFIDAQLLGTGQQIAKARVTTAQAKASRAAGPSKDAAEKEAAAAEQAVVEADAKAAKDKADWAIRKNQPFIMAFDGPAQDYDSTDPFAYTVATLFNDKPKWDQLLWWYFGGKAHRVTKAIRIPLDEPDEAHKVKSLFIGFTGPGACPGC